MAYDPTDDYFKNLIIGETLGIGPSNPKPPAYSGPPIPTEGTLSGRDSGGTWTPSEDGLTSVWTPDPKTTTTTTTDTTNSDDVWVKPGDTPPGKTAEDLMREQQAAARAAAQAGYDALVKLYMENYNRGMQDFDTQDKNNLNQYNQNSKEVSRAANTDWWKNMHNLGNSREQIRVDAGNALSGSGIANYARLSRDAKNYNDTDSWNNEQNGQSEADRNYDQVRIDNNAARSKFSNEVDLELQEAGINYMKDMTANGGSAGNWQQNRVEWKPAEEFQATKNRYSNLDMGANETGFNSAPQQGNTGNNAQWKGTNRNGLL